MGMFTDNENAVLAHLRESGASDLASLAGGCGLARSSIHVAVNRLVGLGVVENASQKGKAVYRMAGRDAVERVARTLVAELKSSVLPAKSDQKKRLVFTDNYVVPEPQLQQLRSRYEVVTFPESHAYISDDVFLERSRGANVIVRFDTQPIDRAFLSEVPELEAIVFPNCFVANVDHRACAEFGVQLHLPDPMTHKYYTTAQVEYVLNAMLTLIKPLQRLGYQLETVDNYYDWRGNIDDDLFGKRIGLVFEAGSIRMMVQLFQLLGCEIRASNTLPLSPLVSEMGLARYEVIEDLWDWADVIVILDGVGIELDPLLLREEGPRYLINGSGLAEFTPQIMRERIVSHRLHGLAVDLLPHSWNASRSQAAFEDALRLLRDLPNVIITSEAAVFTREAIARGHARVFDILMSLA